MPSSPSLQACWKTSGPSCSSRCSLKRRSGAERASKLASVALRTASGSRRRSSPSSLDQVEGVEEDARVMVSIADAVEARDPVLSARHRLAVDDAGARAQLGECLDDERETVGQVVARPAVELHPRALPAGDHTEAVVLDLVQPLLAGGRLRG